MNYRKAQNKQLSRLAWNWFCRRENRLVPLFVVCLVALFTLLGCRVQQSNEQKAVQQAREAAYAEINAATVEEQNAFYDPIKAEAEVVAKVLYGTALHNTREQQEAVVWCILNRVENSFYPDNVIDVCRQDRQWMGYSDDNPILQELYDVAYDILTGYYEGSYRAMSPEYVFLSWSSTEIVLRDTFEETSHTHYWRA